MSNIRAKFVEKITKSIQNFAGTSLHRNISKKEMQNSVLKM
jgi:hypothetical protein